MYQLSIFSRRA